MQKTDCLWSLPIRGDAEQKRKILQVQAQTNKACAKKQAVGVAMQK
jgi:hypothetical protein